MPFYETTFIARQDISPNEVKKITENYTNSITKSGGKVIKTEDWGLLNLAYKIKKNKKGYYVMLCVDSPYENIKEIERQMKLNENILKNITIKVEEIDMEPSPMLSDKNSDENEELETKETTQIVIGG